MRAEQLAVALREMWASGPEGERVTTMHLFGIRYADDLADFKVRELSAICEAAGGKSTYGTELRKMVNLSKYVGEKS